MVHSGGSTTTVGCFRWPLFSGPSPPTNGQKCVTSDTEISCTHSNKTTGLAAPVIASTSSPPSTSYCWLSRFSLGVVPVSRGRHGWDRSSKSPDSSTTDEKRAQSLIRLYWHWTVAGVGVSRRRKSHGREPRPVSNNADRKNQSSVLSFWSR
jgi:hypothetical protein